uniref:Archaeal ATPase n=1 Tax=uncultured bacterium contig00052 TaxID=1181536 RepID=A0A806KNP3_9BACT|nr:archaeal ATPase [uncultured bacterium contig00052]
MFFGRKSELSELEGIYNSGSFEFVAVYGRRRVGKSTLLEYFAQNKKTVFFRAIEADGKRNLMLFSQAIFECAEIPAEASFESWEAGFEYVKNMANERLVLVMDEYPYLAQAEKSISSILQKYCDTAFKKSKLMLILCGSSMSFMENQVLGYKSPIYGRRTAQMKIEPMGYLDSAKFVPRYSIEQKAIVFGLTGGIPKYLELFDDSVPLKKNIIKNFFSRTGYLYEEPSNLLKQELREPQKYNSIIEAIAVGASKLNDIASKTGLETGAASVYVSSLISLGIVNKESAITEEGNKRKTIYSLADTMFLFWYRHVFGNRFSVISGNAENFYDTEIHPGLQQFMGRVFEKICREYLMIQNSKNKLPFPLTQIGWWRGANPQTRSEEEIDIVGINNKQNSVLLCECKFRNAKTDLSVLKALQEKSFHFANYANRHFMLFSKSKFASGLKQEKGGSVHLVDLGSIYG